jgi:hypothetical protein
VEDKSHSEYQQGEEKHDRKHYQDEDADTLS